MADDTTLPSAPDAERTILGASILDGETFPAVRAAVETDDFATESHRRIYRAMCALYDRGEHIDRVTVITELQSAGQLESVGGFGYLVSLDDGMPANISVDAYVRAVREKAILRRAILGLHRLSHEASLPGARSEEILGRVGRICAELGVTDGGEELRTPYEVLEGEIARVGVDAFLSGGTPGIPTPIGPLNDVIVGLQKGDLILIGARPSIGKTALAMQMARHAAEKGVGCVFFSLEMSALSLSSRIVCGMANIDSQALRQGALNSEEKRRFMGAVAKMRELPIWIDKSCRTVAAMHAKIRRARVAHDVGLVLVDYIQLMDSTGRAESQNHKVSEISRGLKLAAEEFEVPLVALSQLSRPPKGSNPEPALPDLRDSGSLEQDADVVLFLHSPDGKLGTGRRRIIVAKQRNGPVDSLDVSFVGKYQQFRELTPEQEAA
jgi:replicative DNA helicase